MSPVLCGLTFNAMVEQALSARPPTEIALYPPVNPAGPNGKQSGWRREFLIGNRVYDVRLVAAMLVHGVGRILSFNAADFTGYGVVVLHPSAMP